MAKIIRFTDAYVPERHVWINPNAVEKIEQQSDGKTSIFFKSRSSTEVVDGWPDEIAEELNRASA